MFSISGSCRLAIQATASRARSGGRVRRSSTPRSATASAQRSTGRWMAPSMPGGSRPTGRWPTSFYATSCPRNMHRKTARAFAGDAKALETARLALARSYPTAFNITMRLFFYMPFQHSEVARRPGAGLRLVRRVRGRRDHEARRRASRCHPAIRPLPPSQRRAGPGLHAGRARLSQEREPLRAVIIAGGVDSRRLSGRQKIAIERSHIGTEAAEDHALEAALVGFHFAHGDFCRRLLRIAVDAGRDRREGDA